MAYRTNLRRAWPDWRRAARIAGAYGWQTGRKHRVRRTTRGVYVIEPTAIPTDYDVMHIRRNARWAQDLRKW